MDEAHAADAIARARIAPDLFETIALLRRRASDELVRAARAADKLYAQEQHAAAQRDHFDDPPPPQNPECSRCHRHGSNHGVPFDVPLCRSCFDVVGAAQLQREREGGA